MEGLLVIAKTQGPKTKVNIDTAKLWDGNSDNLHGLQLGNNRVREDGNLIMTMRLIIEGVWGKGVRNK